jgi:polar amino acid transport system permease protein
VDETPVLDPLPGQTPLPLASEVPPRAERSTRVPWGRLAVMAAGLAAAVFLVVFTDWARVQRAFLDPGIFREQFPRIVTVAARNTLIFTFFGFAGGLIIGLGIALMRLSAIRPYRVVAAAYVEIFRGLPALITIILVGFVLPIALDVRIPFTYGPGSLALAIVAAAYMAETIRAGIEAVPRGQLEAARSLGMGKGWALTAIIIPQAFRIIIPPLTNELVLLLKDTSLLFVLGTTDQTIELAKFARDGVSDTFNGTPLVAAALVYLVITIPMTRLVALLERRARKAR